MYFILVKILDTTGPLVAGLSRGGAKRIKRAQISFFETLVSAKNSTDFYGNLGVYKKMTHVGHSENYLR